MLGKGAIIRHAGFAFFFLQQLQSASVDQISSRKWGIMYFPDNSANILFVPLECSSVQW